MTKENPKVKWIMENWKVLMLVGTAIFSGAGMGALSPMVTGEAVSESRLDTVIHTHLDPLEKRVKRNEGTQIKMLFLLESMATPEEKRQADSAYNAALRNFGMEDR